MLGKVALLGKGLKLRRLWNTCAEPIKSYEEVTMHPDNDGTAVYTYQARFPTIEDAKMFMELQQLSAELEAEVQGKQPEPPKKKAVIVMLNPCVGCFKPDSPYREDEEMNLCDACYKK